MELRPILPRDFERIVHRQLDNHRTKKSQSVAVKAPLERESFVKRTQCQYCKAWFKTSKSSRRHKHVCPSIPRPAVCGTCGEAFIDFSTLGRHRDAMAHK